MNYSFGVTVHSPERNGFPLYGVSRHLPPTLDDAVFTINLTPIFPFDILRSLTVS